MTRAFVIRPFSKKKDTSGKELDFERVHHELIDPALKATTPYSQNIRNRLPTGGYAPNHRPHFGLCV